MSILANMFNFFSTLFGKGNKTLTEVTPVADDVLTAIDNALTPALSKAGVDATLADTIVSDVLDLVDGVLTKHSAASAATASANEASATLSTAAKAVTAS